jgi:prepilin-type processing-associated H-X9-DG protein
MNDGPAISIPDITDGTSNTILFGEWMIGDGNPNRLSPQDVIAMGDFGPNGEVNDWDAATMTMPLGDAQGAFQLWLASIPPAARKSVGNASRNKSWLGEQWSSGLCGLGMGNTLLPPNSPYHNAQIFGTTAEDFDSPGVYGLSSYHSGGCNIALADGSIRFLKSSTATTVLWAIGSRAQGEKVSDADY